MSFKGAIRSYNAAIRRAEREQAQYERQRSRRIKEELKQLALDSAENEVEEYEDTMEDLLGLHKETFRPLNWVEILRESGPEIPLIDKTNENLVRIKMKQFKPNIFQKFLGLDKRVLLDLNRQLSVALERDRAEYEKAMQGYNKDLSAWNSSQQLAKRILDGEQAAYLDVLNQSESFDRLEELGITVSVDYLSKDKILVNLDFKGVSAIPSDSKELLKSGKLSSKKIPESKINTIFQDHVCSSILNAARDVFSALPVSTVYVNGRMRMLDSSTGHMKNSVVVSAMIPKGTLEYLNLNAIDPSDSMKNFKCNMQFKASEGFSPVDEIHYGSREVA